MRSLERAETKLAVPPRQRILDAACDLFYSRGIRAVSVDEIAAAAQTNKMTLYRHFESKDRLVAEYLRSLNAAAIARDEEAIRPYAGDAYAQLRAVVARVGEDLCKGESDHCLKASIACNTFQAGSPRFDPNAM